MNTRTLSRFQTVIRYIQSRLLESLVWVVVPSLGLVISDFELNIITLGVFLFAAYFSAWHVLLFNDWGGLVRNPAELNRFSDNQDVKPVRRTLLILSLIAFFLSFLLFCYLDLLLGALSLFGLLCSVLYSHPTIHLKESFSGSVFLHFFGTLTHFLLGYCVFIPIDLRGIWFGLFFSLIFTAGHFIHHCLDIEEDSKGEIKTFSTQFGPILSAQIGLSIFFFSHLYLAIIYINGMLTLIELILFSIPLLTHLMFSKRIILSSPRFFQRVTRYRHFYRITYGVITLLYGLMRVVAL